MLALMSSDRMEGRDEMVSGESSALRLVTGVVLFGGIGGEGLAPPCVSSAVVLNAQKTL